MITYLGEVRSLIMSLRSKHLLDSYVECKKGRLGFHFHLRAGNVAVGGGGMLCSVIYRMCYTSVCGLRWSFASSAMRRGRQD